MPVTDPLYISNPERPDEGSSPVVYNEKESSYIGEEPELVFGNKPKDAETYIDESHSSIHQGAKIARKSKITKAKVSILATTLVAATIGGLSIINPLLNRPKLSKESYSLKNQNEIHYKFSLSKTNNYTCSLSLFVGNEQAESLPLDEAKDYDGFFTAKIAGIYRLYFNASNGFDYKIKTLKYTITIQEVSL